MKQPRVAAVMLTKDRGRMAKQAVAAFRAQTYDPASRMLLIFDTGDLTWYDPRSDAENEHQVGFSNRQINWTIGELRNEANSLTSRFDVVVHWDSDDFSHPNRIAEQVALLQSSGADCVGYNEMLFWRDAFAGAPGGIGHAWLYSNPNRGYALGTSLCYWRKTWERKPFPATSVGEDLQFLTGLKVCGVSGIARDEPAGPALSCQGVDVVPRMIARIHSGNTSTAYDPAKMARNSEWKRVPEWDSYVKGIMECA